jgi:hypothetical protein
VVNARTTTRIGKVLSFFGVLVLVLGILQSGAGASNAKAHSSAAPGQTKKHAVTTEAPAVNAPSVTVDCGAYCSTSDGTPSGNGNGDNGNQPCAGCVGNADNQNPGGQHHDGNDHNNGYECDGNNGVAQGNPAHSGCQATTTTAAPTTTTTAPPETTTTQPQATTTTAPQATTTTVAVEGSTTTTAEVLGVQFTRGDEQARGLASTGATFVRPFTLLGALLLLLGVALMTIKVRPQAQA